LMNSQDRPALAIVIVSWNTRELLRRCLESLQPYAAGQDTEVWVVDNGSEDGSDNMVSAEFPDVHLVINTENLGFAAANNQAIHKTRAEHVLLLNPDTEVLPGALDAALAVASERGTPVAMRLLNPDGTLQHSCFRFPHLGLAVLEAFYLHWLLPRSSRGELLLAGYWDHARERNVDWVIGAFLLVPSAAIQAAGLLPEEYFIFGEDMAWCHRLTAAGFPVRFLPVDGAIHHGNQSGGQLPPEWRIARTHRMKYKFCEAEFGRVRTRLHRTVDLVSYVVRVALFSLLSAWQPRRRDQLAEYKHIVRTLLARREEIE
jgi:GT2 family glycosyltransferase